MNGVVRSLWAEPRVLNPPARGWRDRVLVVGLVTAGVLETLFREGLEWRGIALILGVAPVFALLWRRTDPLTVVALVFGAQTLADVAPLFGADKSVALFTAAYVLLLPYSLGRWGSGREVAIGVTIILIGHVFRETVNSTGLDVLIGIPFFLFPAALGASMRYRAASRHRETDQVKLHEREQLARELHDTVAHHVSAIAIRAQAGRILAASEPRAAVEALEVIEEAASRTLVEMRIMVGALRQGEEPDLGPQRGVADRERLADSAGEGPRVDVELTGRLTDLRPLLEAAIYRLAQESITNAIRHARHATRIDVRVAGDNDSVCLTVRDDGDTGPFGAGSPSGYGLVGMTERVTLLGGTLEAGPGPDSGWTVNAMLPRSGSAP